MNQLSLLHHINKPAIFLSLDLKLKEKNKAFQEHFQLINLPKKNELEKLASGRLFSGWYGYIMGDRWLLVASDDLIKTAKLRKVLSLRALEAIGKREASLLAQLPGIAYWKNRDSIY